MTHNAALFTSASAEHNTPPDIIAAICDVFGEPIDLDPASNDAAQSYIQAERYFTIDNDGLRQSWVARTLWLNPPFTIASGRINARTGKEIRERVIDQWVDRWLINAEGRFAQQSALLVPARTDTEWFEGLYGYPMCFVSGRLRFSDAKNGATFPTVIVYAGNRTEIFYNRFSQIGNVGKFTR